MDDTFINSVLYKIFVDESQSLIDGFVRDLEIDGAVFEALELDLIKSVRHYDPKTFAGYSHRYQEIWDNLKQQARVIDFINSLILGRGEYELSGMFVSLLTATKAKKQQDYVCTMERECFVLVKSWDLYSLRGSGRFPERIRSLRRDAAAQHTIKPELIEELIRATTDKHNDDLPRLISDQKYLKCFAEFITKEGLDEACRRGRAAYSRYYDQQIENKENLNKIMLSRSGAPSQSSDDEGSLMIVVDSSTPLHHGRDVNRRKLLNNDLSQFDATPFSTPGSIPKPKSKFVTRSRNAGPVTLLPM